MKLVAVLVDRTPVPIVRSQRQEGEQPMPFVDWLRQTMTDITAKNRELQEFSERPQPHGLLPGTRTDESDDV